MRLRITAILALALCLYLAIAPRLRGGPPSIPDPAEMPGLSIPDLDEFKFDPWDINDIPPPPPDFPEPFDDLPPLPPDDPFDDPFSGLPDPPIDLPPLPPYDFTPNQARGAIRDATTAVTPAPIATYRTYVRQANGSYALLVREAVAPYNVLNPASELIGILAGGLKKLLPGARTPAGVGWLSQPIDRAGGQTGPMTVVVGAGDSSVTVNSWTNGKLATKVYPIGPDVNSVMLADFNGDGNPDLAVAFDGSSTVPGGIAILLNKGDGTFSSPVSYGNQAPAAGYYSGGTPATHFVAYDLNHDGALDIATAALNGTVTVFLGKGDGTFGAPVQYPVAGASGQAIAVADFDGDGIPDLAAGGTTGILLGNGDGSFRAGPALPAVASGSYVWALAAGDLNGDGSMDLVYVDIENQVVVPMVGNGHGSFQAGQGYAVATLPDNLILTDYNGDGRLDIIVGSGDARSFGAADNSGLTNILINSGDGTFAGMPTYFTLPNAQAGVGSNNQRGLAVANFGGSFPGLLLSNYAGLTLFPGDGKGGLLAPQAIVLQNGAGAIAAADFNGDGIADAAVASGPGIALLAGKTGGFGAPTAVSTAGLYPGPMVSGDFDGDGKADVAFLSPSPDGTSAGALVFLKGNGDGTFGAPAAISAGMKPLGLAAADLNGDGKLDLVIADSGANGTGAVYVALNQGGGVFHAPVAVYPGIFPRFAIGDVNEDGRPDLVVAAGLVQTGQAAVSWLAGNGDGTFEAPVAISSSDSTDLAVLARDLNGDGHLDIVLGNEGSTTTFMLGDGSGKFTAETPFLSAAQTDPMFLAAADLNGDGRPDLIVAGLTVSVLLSRPAAQVTIETNPPGLQFSLDGGAARTAPQTLALSQGPHMIASGTQAGSGGAQYTFTGWSDDGAAAHLITMGAEAATFTATFNSNFASPRLSQPRSPVRPKPPGPRRPVSGRP